MEFEGMYDGRFKVRLLSSIMGTYLPDDRQPPRSPSELSMAVSFIRRHHLLSEPVGPADAHKAAMDAWVERINLLLSSNMTEKCWAGVCLLGVTCQECTRQRFVDSYMSWFQKLVLHLKPTDPLFVRGAAFASLNDLLARLGSIGVRREGTALSVKLVQPVLQLLSDEGSKSIWKDDIDMLHTILKFFPASVKQQSSQVETLLVAKLMEVDTVASLSQVQKFARCLALIPRADGDAATWNSLFRRILLAINCQLDDAFKGMEDGAIANKVLSCLMPRGQEQTWFLGSMPIAANAMAEGAKRFWQLLVPRVSAFIQCCNYLLVNSFPVQVPVPLTASLALVTRILLVDGTTYGSASVLGMPTSSEQQVSLCCELPALHSCALDLLFAVLCGVRGQLLPRAADVVRLLTDYFHRCGLPSLRVKLYNISKHLLISMGVGMATELAPALLDNLLADLKRVDASCSLNSPNAMSWGQGVSGWGHVANPRKRKDPGGTHMDPLLMGVGEPAMDRSEAAQAVAVQTAALEAAEALLTVGGALRSDQWRAEIDAVVARVASIASMGSLSPSLIFEDISWKGASLMFSSGSFQMAAYKALLASILSPCMHRPPYLSQALTIFRKGRLEAAGTDLAAFCAHALLALEPLLHPRSLPLASPPPAETMHAIAPGRGPAKASDSLVTQIQRPVLPLQGGTGTLSSAAIGGHGYCSQMVAPSSLKVNDSGMQIEVEGDPYVYVQEDIESWIVDYGGDQSMLNDGSCSMVVEGYEGEFPTMGNPTQNMAEFPTMGNVTQNMAPFHTMGNGSQSVAEFQAMGNASQNVAEFQAMGNATQNVVAELGQVSARQSLADDEDRVMMSMVGDLLAEPREVSRAAVPGKMPMDDNLHASNVNSVCDEMLVGGPFQAKASNGGVPGMLEGQKMAMRVMDGLVPASESHGLVIPASEPMAAKQGCVEPCIEMEELADLRSNSQQQEMSGATQQKQELLPPLQPAAAPKNVSFPASAMAESDSDAIPDIVDGDPDTD